MKDRIDNLLLGLLWLLAMTLGTSFWMNSHYGFNIFAGPHWRYLADMQAAQQPVKVSFYCALATALILMLGGLYIILRPRVRRVATPKIDTHQTVSAPTNTQPATAIPAPQNTPKIITGGLRPPRAQIPQSAPVAPAPTATPPTPVATTPAPTAPTQPASTNIDTIRQIFDNAGYYTKTPPRVRGIATALLATGANESIWIGATNVTHDQMQTIIDAYERIFDDTLDDAIININAFIVAPRDNAQNTRIMDFATIDDLNAFIAANPNNMGEPDEYFDAFDGYITTVAGYIGKI